MSEFRIAHRYAKSLLDLSIEKSQVEEVYNDVKLFGTTIEESRDLKLLLKSPIIPSQKKKDIIETVFSEKSGTIFMEFLRIVIRKGREEYLSLIIKEFQTLYNNYKGIQKASITTTFKLNKKLKEEFISVIKKITSKDVELTEQVNENLIGGFILKIGDRQIDESVSSKLRELKRNLIDQSFVKTI